jgi:phosphoglycolate phosphatase-like HAD superfamily hydrolase
VTITLPVGAIFDMDGTLSDDRRILFHLLDGRFDLDAYMRDAVDTPAHPEVLRLLLMLQATGIPSLILTARNEKWRDMTATWLAKHGVTPAGIWLTTEGDPRTHAEMKRDQLADLRKAWDPVLEVDDNPANVDMFRQEGIITIHVPGYHLTIPAHEQVRIPFPQFLNGTFDELLDATA